MTFEELIGIGNANLNSRRVNRYIKTGDCVCVIESSDGSIYLGNSVSFSNSAFCAEQSAILSMFGDSKYEIARLVTVSKAGDVVPPCGRCLELISQTNNCENAEIAISKFAQKPFRELYPYDWKNIETYNFGMPILPEDKYNLNRFLIAQEQYYNQALSEIKNGKKETNWIWFIWPTHKKLAKNVKSDYYGIGNMDEAKEYCSNKVLMSRLVEISEALINIDTTSLDDVVSENDKDRIQASMTLFYYASGHEVFKKTIEKYFFGAFHRKTIKLIDEENRG